jgi:Holliday junction resolvase RusA-like endonuclease
MEVLFVLPRCSQDLVVQQATRWQHNCTYPVYPSIPRAKDLDNLLKFVMDAFQGVIFCNNVTITKVFITKMYVQNANARGWTEVQLSSTSSQSAWL